MNEQCFRLRRVHGRVTVATICVLMLSIIFYCVVEFFFQPHFTSIAPAASFLTTFAPA